MADSIREVRDRTLAELVEVVDYYTHTKMAWTIVRQNIEQGNRITVQSVFTGSTITESDLVEKASGYVSRQLTEATFQQFISIFENFLFDLVRLWLVAYPHSLDAKQVSFKSILDAPDKEAITLEVVEK